MTPEQPVPSNKKHNLTDDEKLAASVIGIGIAELMFERFIEGRKGDLK